MDDPELEQIRKQRLAQMQAQHGGTGDPNQGKAQEERMQAMEEAKNTILSQALSQDARARLRNKISEQELIQLLESLNQQMPKTASTVKFDRRRAALDSDDDL
ncbi:hypothetical protein MSG28_005180 [Choristoneura fumiferana]|uniref:Uncharacterized protein n=1 Tax=Choristoneura fumiferana TaxID=7141 RepID=A0ACC0JQ91_CHOFU|nr:hypothetical protein MSG28_005180 [Choristoneura fumiferana]